jgi:CubicO group peptidase (beta-lactamase class C family)
MRLIFRHFALVILSVACLQSEASDDSAIQQKIDQLQSGLLPAVLVKGEELVRKPLADRMEELGVPGVGIAIINDGVLEWAGGFGLSDVAQNRPVTARTMFQAASISKPVAAMAALELVERGQLGLDTDINESLLSWQVPATEYTVQQQVTLRRLVSHTAGVTVHGFRGYDPDEVVPSTLGVLMGDGNSDPITVDTVPGTLWRYSGGGYTIMQLAMHDVSRMEFTAILDQMVLWPLNMTSSTYSQPLPKRFHTIAATGYRGDGSQVAGRWHTYPERAAAGLWTTPSDLARWLIALQSARQGQSHPVLDPETVEAMLTPGMGNWGLGPVIEGEGKRFGHGGSNEGFRCNATAFLDGNQGVVVMTNSDTGTTLISEITMTIAEIYSWPDPLPSVKTVIDLPTEGFKAFEGTYENEYGNITFVHASNRLRATSSFMPGANMEFRPESENRFFDVNGSFLIDFDTNNEGDGIVVINEGIVFVRTANNQESE